MSDIVERLRARPNLEMIVGDCAMIREAADEIARLRAEFSRFMTICGEGSPRGRAMDLIPKADWERARRALEQARKE